MLPKQPNENFVFHNKLPKCGSTTMHDILRQLSTKNSFHYVKMDAQMMNFDEENKLIEWLQANMREPFFLMQHHYYMNFTKYGYFQPTMINVIREPVDWFSSHYHFKLYGWQRNPGQREYQSQDQKPMVSTEISRLALLYSANLSKVLHLARYDVIH